MTVLIQNRRGLIHAATYRYAVRFEGKQDRSAHARLSPNPDIEVCNAMLALWIRDGAQSVRLPHTFAAALMATDARHAFAEVRHPWPSYEIQVPAGLLPSPVAAFGDVFSLLVGAADGEGDGNAVIGAYDERTTFTSSLRSALADEAFAYREMRVEMPDTTTDIAPDLMASQAVRDAVQRTWLLVGRLVLGVALTIAAARREVPGTYAARPARKKHDYFRPNEFTVGEPLRLDCREQVRSYALGTRSTSPTVTTLVRGHWRHQTHGPNHSLRRLQWIQPFFRGEGPLLVRPTHIGGAS